MNCPFMKVTRGWWGDNTWVHRLSFSQRYCQFNLTFQSVSPPCWKPHLQRGPGEKKDYIPTPDVCVSSLVPHIHSPPLPPTNTRSTSKQSASKWKRGNARLNSPYLSLCFPRAAAESHTIRRVWSRWKEAATRPAEGEAGWPAFRSCPSQVHRCRTAAKSLPIPEEFSEQHSRSFSDCFETILCTSIRL